MKFVLQTGPNHPGQRMFVQVKDGKSAFDMDSDLSRAMRFNSKAAAMKYAKRLSSLYGLEAIGVIE